MKDSCYLVFSDSGISRMSKRRPPLKAGDYAVLIKIDVPDEVFAASIPEATLKIPKENVVRPPIEMEVAEPFFGKKGGKKVRAT